MTGPYERSPWCARWAPGAAVVDVAHQLGIEHPRDAVVASWNAEPHRAYPIVARDAAGALGVRDYGWGLGRPEADAVLPAEEMFVDPRIAPRIRRGRCLVPAAAFYVGTARDAAPEEWSPPHAVRPPTGEPMALAGVWSAWRERGARVEAVVRSFAILTRVAYPPVSTFSPRMPVVVPRADWARWLDPAAYDDDLGRLPWGHVALTVYPVSEAVYGRADRAELLARLDPSG